MKAIIRNIGAVLAGFVLASLTMMIVERINGRLLYPGLAKAAEGVRDREAMRAIFASAPVGALLVVVFGWGLGGLAGGWVAARIAGPSAGAAGFALCTLLVLAGVANNLMLPPPSWFWAASLVVMAAATLAGARLAGSSRP